MIRKIAKDGYIQGKSEQEGVLMQVGFDIGFEKGMLLGRICGRLYGLVRLLVKSEALPNDIGVSVSDSLGKLLLTSLPTRAAGRLAHPSANPTNRDTGDDIDLEPILLEVEENLDIVVRHAAGYDAGYGSVIKTELSQLSHLIKETKPIIVEIGV